MDRDAGGKVAAFGGFADAPRSAEPADVMARRIGGARIERLAGHHDARGALVPFLVTAAPFGQEPIVWGDQFTILASHCIMGLGMHERQTDRYLVVAGDLRAVLYDGPDGVTGPRPLRRVLLRGRRRRTALHPGRRLALDAELGRQPRPHCEFPDPPLRS